MLPQDGDMISMLSEGSPSVSTSIVTKDQLVSWWYLMFEVRIKHGTATLHNMSFQASPVLELEEAVSTLRLTLKRITNGLKHLKGSGDLMGYNHVPI